MAVNGIIYVSTWMCFYALYQNGGTIMKRILALLLVLLMIFALVGCKDNKRQVVKVTLSTEDSEAILAAAGIRLPEAEACIASNTVVDWLCWYDPFQNYSQDEIVNTGYFTFTEKYGCSINWIECEYGNRLDTLANLVLAGNAPDCFPAGTAATATYPMSCIKGMFTYVDDYIDYTDPLWQGVADAAEYFVLGDKHYSIITDITFRDVCVYNRRVMEEWGFDDPAQLYANDEWTWDVFYNMCMDFSDGDENRYALDGYAYQGGLVQSTGQQVLQIDENGIFYSNIDSPEIERAQNLVYDLVKNDCCYHEGNNRWALRNNGTFGAGLKEGLCLFYVIETSYFTGPVEEISSIWGDVSQGEVMFAPMPRDPNGDGKYYLNTAINGLCMVSGGDNLDGVALLASCERFKKLDPTVIDIDKKQLREKYLWTDEMLEMYDTCYELVQQNTIMFYTGNLNDGLNNAYNSVSWGINRAGASSSWAQLKERYSESIDYYIEELNALISDYNA